MDGLGSSLLFLVLGNGFLYYAFRTQRKERLMKVIGVLVLVFAVTFMYERKGPNLYDTLEMDRTNMHDNRFALEIRSAYKSLSKKYHPDKNSAEDAIEKFARIKFAHDTLIDEQQRDIYNRFGEDALSFDPRNDELRLLGGMGAIYLLWCVCLYAITTPPESRTSRTWSAVVGVVLMVIELTLCLSASTLPNFFPARLTEHEFVVFCHSVFPVIMLILRCVAETVYVDINETSKNVLSSILGQHNNMNKLLEELVGVISEGGDGDVQMIQKLRTKIDKSNESIAIAIHELKTSNNDPIAQYYWVLLVAMYGGLYLLSGGE